MANKIGFLSLGELINMPLLDFNISNITGHLSSAQFFAIYTIICGLGYGLSSVIFSYFTDQVNLGFLILIGLSFLTCLILIIISLFHHQKQAD